MLSQAYITLSRMSQPNHRSYRPDIDGLRAVAVLSVLTFHAFPSKLPGGFIGVDIFFVISGYLISTILIGSITAGSFTFADFYGRRVRRIFPALAAVLASSMVAGWFILLPTDFAQLGLHVAASAAFISNFVLWSESGYFDGAADYKILLHLWSLAIEAQFYIFWPVLLLLAHRLRLGFGRLLLGAAAASFAFGLWQIRVDAVAAFFNPLSRAWELLVGAGVAYFFAVRAGRVPVRVSNILAPVGAALIGAGLIMLDKRSTFPGISALLPTLGAAFIILAGQQTAFNRILLGNPIMVTVGLISYPLYLWHWPLLAFTRIIEGGNPAVHVCAGALAASLVLAWATYLILEKRLRAGRFLINKAILLGTAILLCACAGLTVLLADGLPQRARIAPYINLDQMLKTATKWEYAENSTCLNRYPTSYRKEGWWFCVMNKDKPPTLMIMGNSFGNHLYPGIANNPAFRGQTVLQFGTCDPAMGLTYSAYNNGHSCKGAGRVNQEELSNQIVASTPSLKVVLLSAPWPFFNDTGDSISYYDPDKIDGYYSLVSGTAPSSYAAFMTGLERRISFLIQHDITPVIVLATPVLGYSPDTCYSGQPFRQSNNTCVVSRSYQNRIQKRFRAGVSEIQTRHPELKVFDPLPALCDETICNLKGPNGPLLRDLGHLSLIGSEIVGQAFAQWAAQNLPVIVSH
jgi:peptidoglycan/LPS O-acetylase OafA/YrhL